MVCLFQKDEYSTNVVATCPASTTCNWFIKVSAMLFHVLVIMHVKDPQLSIVRIGHCVKVAVLCLSPYSLHVLNRDVDIINRIK